MFSWWAAHLKELGHWVVHLITLSVLAWIHQERQTLKDVLEHKLERRLPMVNLQEIEAGLALAPELLPALIEVLQDGEKFMADLQAIVTKIQAVGKTSPAPAPGAPAA